MPVSRSSHEAVRRRAGRVSRARALWQFGEPIHAVIYYSPERRAATDALGLKGGRSRTWERRRAVSSQVSADDR